MATRATQLGWRGESLVLADVRKRDFVLVERNFRTRNGEIDLIMEDAGTLVFIEVKTRRSMRYGPIEESMTDKKRERMNAAMETYLQRNPTWKGPVRCDIALVSWHGDVPSIRYIRSI